MQEVGIEQVCSDNGTFLLVDKPVDWTSFDVVAKVRNAYRKSGLKCKVGHCGTLDPKATGLLILATGGKTREISGLEMLDKVYEGTIRLGAMTESHDTETPEYGHCDIDHLDHIAIRAAAASFIGPSFQQPPMHSAVRHNGKRLYELARKGQVVRERKAREIMIHRFEITSVELPNVSFVLEVSKGSYIRVIAHEFGQLLGVGGYLSSLRRTSIGPYAVSGSRSVQETVEAIYSGCVLPIAQGS
ncbi:MAG: tRNA pseudouridine(55) synthase TruB [Chlorobium sp.]|uniref:tRNA pseudouridine(55) synthase TruB n=1 Tax=Chlorobium sp. TaxID=1095 RepID=UPI001DC56AD8|nr:tRNA pseudouridine(55) synthase TruB [Chlorobium sp.]MBN1279876.1 tRNA pseudouridine(55) synthase TruB [Chlorobiaceae bacterium]MCF8217001.1 tRNA pseudouridine(55) synthase TruB [Chlorobium sp.]MCF8271831.1 tRNA pseudouridine(55) synthase TruB [Chlorobium sp.]MCF8288218.1 tRNA pseudouridine(55) synthase TruB [Chlorobium sp.]MCF8291793.1 tRNA pseudouridine(55) synthase TruB [Chlorobium sp.]